MDNYTISGINIMITTSQINETTLTVPYNARQTIEVAATNCIGTSRTAMFTYSEGGVMVIMMIELYINCTYNCTAPNGVVLAKTVCAAVLTNV